MDERQASDGYTLLTEAEREALERPGLKQRSKAVVAVAELATKIGLSDNVRAVLIDHIRTLDRDEAKLAWRTIGDMNELLETFSIDLGGANEGEIVLRQDTETLSSDRTPVESPGEPDVPRRKRRGSSEQSQVSIDEVAPTGIKEALDNLISDEGENREYVIKRVESLLDQLAKGGVKLALTAEDFTHDTLKQLAVMYSETTKVNPDTVKTNIACTWGWLSGIEMETLRIMRSSVKPDANAQDVHNSRASFISGVIKGWKQGMRPVFEGVDDPSTNSDLNDEDIKEVEPVSSIPTPERLLENEPMHIQLAEVFIERLQLQHLNRRALEELLNPNARGDYTPAKNIVIEAIRMRVGHLSPDGNIIGELDTKPRGKQAVRRLLGMGFIKNGHTEERSPQPLKDQLRHIDANERQAYADDLYEALLVLLNRLADSSQAQPHEETNVVEADFQSHGIEQVKIVDGEPQLIIVS